jgi:hypothetical protein
MIDKTEKKKFNVQGGFKKPKLKYDFWTIVNYVNILDVK